MRADRPEQNALVGAARVVRHVWSGMILAGLAIAALVWALWPQPTNAIEPAAEPRPVGVLALDRARSADAGPPEVPSEAELEVDYVRDSPEELGADPLPGAELTPEPPPVAG